jgi:N-ethylmaleimide reductase
MMTKETQKLFSPVQIGAISLGHRVVMAPLTRSRSEQPGDIPGKLMQEYYSQRASEGGFIISEATSISIAGRGWFGAPGMYTDEQVAGWKKITDEIHAKGARMFSQLWHVGRSSHLSMTNGSTPVAPSAVPPYWVDATPSISTPTGWDKPSPHRALDIAEIPGIIEDYRRAAERAKAAGFDGVELHAANGYLLDEFLQDGSNKRTDAYGGGIENRAKLMLEVSKAVAAEVGPGRTGIRISPVTPANDVSDSNPQPLFDHIVDGLEALKLAYIHVIEGATGGPRDIAPFDYASLRKRFKRAYIANNGYDFALAEKMLAANAADLIAFGKPFISNPDLVERLRRGAPLNEWDKATFYGGGAKGYTDYPTLQAKQAAE